MILLTSYFLTISGMSYRLPTMRTPLSIFRNFEELSSIRQTTRPEKELAVRKFADQHSARFAGADDRDPSIFCSPVPRSKTTFIRRIKRYENRSAVVLRKLSRKPINSSCAACGCQKYGYRKSR